MTDIAQPTIDLLTKALVNAMADQVRRRATFERSLTAANTIGDYKVATTCARAIDSLNTRIMDSAMALQIAGLKDVGGMVEKMQAATEPPKPESNVLTLVRPS
jgi:hypothetical protein